MASLAPLIVWHALVGAALALGVWMLGLALLGTVREAALDGYAVGLIVATAAAFIYLLEPLAGLAALAVLAVTAGVRLRSRRLPRVSSSRFAWSLPPALAFGTILGFLLHGPTEELDSAAFGDMLFYVDKLVSATQSVVPYRDLLVEGERLVYVESGPSFLAAPLLEPLGLDPVLVQAALFPTFLLTALAFGFVVADVRPTLVASVLAAGALAYPSWVTETPPAALALPLTFSLYGHLVAPRRPLVVAAIAVVVGVDLLLTKVLGLIPAAVVLAAILLERSGRTGRDRLLRVALPLAVAAAAAVALLVLTIPWQASLAEAKVLPLEAVRSLDEVSAAAAAPAATIVGQVLVLAAFTRARLVVPAVALAASLVGFWFAHRYNFDIAAGVAVLLAALLVARTPERFRLHDRLLLLGGVALLVSAWWRELVGLRAGFVLLVLLVAVFVAAAGERRRAGAALVTGAAATVVALFAGERVQLRPFHATLTTSDYEIWQRVREVVPADALVFTTLTGPRILPYEGWHNYPSIAGRQLYIAGWYDGRLVADEAERRRKLRLNDAVARNGGSPRSIPTKRRYASFWLVRAHADAPPPRGRLVYANERFALHELVASTFR